MKQCFFLISFLISLASCNSLTQKEEGQAYRIEVFVENFITKYPNWNKNDVLKGEANDNFKADVLSEIEKSLLIDFPSDFDYIEPYKDDQFAAVFRSWGSWKSYNIYGEQHPIMYDTSFDIVGIVNDSLMRVLQKNNRYIISGTFVKDISTDFKSYTSSSVYTNRIRIDSLMFDGFTVSLGVLLFDVDSVRKVAQ